MENNIKMYPKKICRTCLCESSSMRSLSAKIEGEERTIIEVLAFVANINVLIENQLPDQVCNECESILYKADAFKRRCLESEMILTQQIDIPNQGHINDEFSKVSIVKDEQTTEASDKSLNDPSCSSNDAVKPSNSSISEIFNSFSNKDEKFKFFTDVTISKHNDDSNDEIKTITTEQNSFKGVKTEENNEIEQNDVSFDYDDSESYDTLLVDYKKEPSKESKGLTCSCGVVCENKNEYRLHLFTTNCSGFKYTKKRVKKNGNGMTVNKIICSVCKEEFNTVKACKIHKRKHTKEDFNELGSFECSMCMRKFSRKSAYTNHMKNHEMKSTVMFTCDTCKREFRHKAHLDNHILSVHTREKGFACEICMCSFTTEASLEVHRESHKVEKKHVCDICKKAFYMLSTLNDHLRVHTGEKPYLCSICGKGFSQKTNLAQHVRRHQGLKPFKCEDCDRRFVSKGELTAHSRSHSGAHPFVCEDCGSGFTTSSSLVKHRRTHTGERPYACDLCPMRFAASGTLKNHRRTHTGEKPFQCSYCEKAFVQRHDLISHIRGHTGERPYTCGCGQAFRKASALKAHVRLHGKEPQRDITLLQPSTMLLGTMPAGHIPTAPLNT